MWLELNGNKIAVLLDAAGRICFWKKYTASLCGFHQAASPNKKHPPLHVFYHFQFAHKQNNQQFTFQYTI